MKLNYKFFVGCLLTACFTVTSFAQEEIEMVNDKREKGLEMVGKLFAGTAAGSLPFPEDFGRYTIEHLFGDVWQGEEMTLQERSLATCVTLVALNREAEQKLHFVAARNLGIPREKLEAAITQVAHYAGWPVAVSAFRVLSEVWPAENGDSE